MRYSLLIKKYRLLRNMTQQELARKSHVSQNYISQLERNDETVSPTLRVLFDIGLALNICPHKLIQYHRFCPSDCGPNCEP